MTSLKICGVRDLAAKAASFQPDLIISIRSPEDDARKSADQALEGVTCPVLILEFDHTETLNRFSTAPMPAHAEAVVAALDEHLTGDKTKLLVHCTEGQSRSPAVAILALGHLALRSEPASADLAQRIVEQVKAAAPLFEPNHRMVDIAEYQLEEFQGDLLAATFPRKPEMRTLGHAQTAPISKSAKLRRRFGRR